MNSREIAEKNRLKTIHKNRLKLFEEGILEDMVQIEMMKECSKEVDV